VAKSLEPLRQAILDAVAIGINTRWALGADKGVSAAAYAAAAADGQTVHDHIEEALRSLWRGGHLRRADPNIAGSWVVSDRHQTPGPLQLAILKALEQGPTTTLGLIERTGGRRPSIWRACERLCTRGLAQIVGHEPARRGLPSPIYGLVNPSR